MKRMIVSLVVMVLTTVLVMAANEDTNVSPVSVEVSVGVMSKYLDPRSGAVYTDGPVAQDEVTVSMLGFDFNIWHNTSLERRAGKTDGDEIDYTISKTVESLNGTLEVGASYYDFARLCNGRQDNAYAGYIEAVSSDIDPADAFITVNYARLESVITTPGSSFEGGTFITLGGRSEFDLLSDIKILEDISFTRDDGVYGLEPDIVFAYNLSVEADKWGWTFTPNFILAVPFHGGAETVFGLSASHEF